MIAAWMLYCTGIAFVIGAAAVALERTGRLIGLSGRWVWGGALLATLALPLAALYRPAAFQSIVVPVPPVQSQSGASAPPTMSSAPSVLPSKPAFSLPDLDRPLELLWGGFSIALLGFGVVAAARLDLLRRKWRSVTVDGTPVLVSANLGPAVVGVVRSRLVIPEWTLELEPRLRELMLAHEREHILAGDQRLLAATAVLLAVMPWNLGLWWQWRHLRLAVEMDCDARVLRRHPDRARYGGLLLEVSQRAARNPLPVAAFHEPMSLLERRLRAITSGRPKRFLTQAAMAAITAAGLMVGACEAPLPTAPVAKPGPFSIRITNEDGQITSKFIRDSVARFFPEIAAHWANQPVYLWFVLSPEGAVERHGTSSRDTGNTNLNTGMIPSIVPGFAFPKAQSVTLVGSDAMGPGSPPVVWVQLRDPSKPATYLPDPLSTVDTVVEKPVRLVWTPPAYPPLLRLAGIQGVVIVEAIIDTTGRAEPNSVKIVKSPHPGFDQSVQRAILDSRWRPSRVNGKPVRMLIQEAITFHAEH
jgi:TonB family protein